MASLRTRSQALYCHCQSGEAHVIDTDVRIRLYFRCIIPTPRLVSSQDAIWNKTHVDFQVDNVEGEKGAFTLDGKELVDPGFLEVRVCEEACVLDIDVHSQYFRTKR